MKIDPLSCTVAKTRHDWNCKTRSISPVAYFRKTPSLLLVLLPMSIPVEGGRERWRERAGGYIEDDLMENDLKSFSRAFSSLGNWIMI